MTNSGLIKQTLKLQFVIWALGLYMVGLYMVLALSLKNVVNYFRTRDNLFILIIVFFFLQLLSISLSPLNEYFSFSRFLAIFHNLVVFLFFICGYVSYKIESIKENLLSYSKLWLYSILFLSIGVFVSFYIIETPIKYNGLIAILTGVVNNHTIVEFNAIGYLLGLPFPRSQILGIFSNTTSILIVLFYIIFIIKNGNQTSKLKLFFIHCLVIVAIVTTGSRNATFLAIASLPFVIISNQGGLIKVTIAYLIALFLVIEFDILNLFLEARGGSNDLRFRLYRESINIFLRQNPFTGLGIKPKSELFYNTIPIGSHSSLIGYFVKSGILAGMMYLVFQLFLIFDFIFYYVKGIMGKPIVFNDLRFKLMLNILFGLFLFDDMDAYEPVAFFTGYVVGANKS